MKNKILGSNFKPYTNISNEFHVDITSKLTKLEKAFAWTVAILVVIIAYKYLTF